MKVIYLSKTGKNFNDELLTEEDIKNSKYVWFGNTIFGSLYTTGNIGHGVVELYKGDEFRMTVMIEDVKIATLRKTKI